MPISCFAPFALASRLGAPVVRRLAGVSRWVPSSAAGVACFRRSSLLRPLVRARFRRCSRMAPFSSVLAGGGLSGAGAVRVGRGGLRSVACRLSRPFVPVRHSVGSAFGALAVALVVARRFVRAGLRYAPVLFRPCRRVALVPSVPVCGLTHPSTGPAQKAAQAGEVKRWAASSSIPWEITNE
jgi:hypothetical protein